MKLKTRLIFINLGIILLITAGSFGFLLWNTYSTTKLSSIESINNQVLIVASEMEAIIDDALSDARGISSTIAYMKMAGGYDRAVVSELLRAKLESSENYIYAWVAFEPDAFDGLDEMFKGELGSDDNGRFMPSWGRSADDLILELCTDVETSDYYSVPKSSRESFVTDPTSYKLDGEDVTTVTFSEPIIVDGKLIGVAGIDISLSRFREIVSEVKFFDNGYGKLLNDKGIMLSYNKETLSTDDIYEYYVPIDFEDSEVKWSYGVIVPRSEMMASTNRLIMILLLVSALGIVIMGLIMYINSKYVVDSIVIISESIDNLAAYDLSFNSASKVIGFWDRKDETGDMTRSLSDMQSNFIKLISSVKGTAELVNTSATNLSLTSSEVSVSADEVAGTVESLANGASEQALETEKGAREVSELGELISASESAMESVVDMAETVKGLVEEGLSVVSDLSSKTADTGRSTDEVYNIIVKTNESSEKISSASIMIASIADQTNLLALNAAIEAARAGDAGRGFAVVAEEIRKLAEQSTKSTKDIDEVLEELIINSSSAVSKMEETASIIVGQVRSVKDTESKYTEIASAMKSTALVIEEMKSSSLDMQSKKSSILELVQSLSAIAEENAASTEEVSASIEEQLASIQGVADASEGLSASARELSGFVDKFKL